MEETTSAKKIFTGYREFCSKERKNSMEENSKSSPDATNQFKGFIVGISKNNDGNGAVKTMKQEEVLKAVENIKLNSKNEGASGTKRSISGISQEGNNTPSISKRSKTKTNTPNSHDPKQE